MDAKPLRSNRVLTNENEMPSAMLPNKTLHQRTKSVPALGSAARNAASRTTAAAVIEANKKILGEVNANIRLTQTKDDSALVKKFAPIDILKGALPRLSTQAPATRNPLDVAQANGAPLLQERAKKLLVKKSTKVLKDVNTSVEVVAPLPVVAESIAPQAEEKLADDSITTTTTTSASLEPAAITVQIESQNSEPQDNVALNIEPQPVKAIEPLLTTTHIVSTKLDTQIIDINAHLNSGVSLPSANAYPHLAQHEYFVEEDCSTTRSFGLHGQSMGSITTILAPEQTDKTRLEILTAKEYVNSTRTEEEIDDDEWDTSMVAEYSEEIFEYMRKLEARMLPNPRYMELQTEIQWSMRAVLVDWVVQVHQRFTLLPETLFLAVNYIDRFLSNKIVSLGKLQLVGATALFIAAKFEEVNCPTLQEIIFMVDGGYTVDELLKAERFMLSMLQFDLGWPGPMSFLRRISKADDYDLETRTLAKYFLEVTMMDERFVGCTPSYLAAGSHCIARLMLRKGDWSVAHVAYSEYTYAQLRPLLQAIIECCECPQKHHMSVYEKYTDKRYKRASSFVEGEMLKGFSLSTRSLIQSSMDSYLDLRPTVMV